MKEEKNNKIETPQLRGLEVNPQLMRSETKRRRNETKVKKNKSLQMGK